MRNDESKMTTVAEEAKNAQPPTLAQLLKNQLQTVKYIKEGDVVDAEFMSKNSRGVFFDLGRFGTGIVSGHEISNAKELLKKAKAGDKLPAKIISLENKAGYIEISLAEAGKQQLWQKVKDAQEEGSVLKVKITGSNTGGLTADLFDLKAFLPVSQLSTDNYPKVEDGDKQKISDELKKFIGQELSVKVIDINPRLNKLIISERETLSSNLKELVAQYEVGQVLKVLVTSLANFGVFVRFVDNPQVEGLIHISELSYRIVGNPKEVVQVNEVVDAKIIDIKEDRLFLSLKVLQEDPWKNAESLFKAGEDVSGTVYQFNQFGAIINLNHGLQGMIHVSEFGSIDDMKKKLVLDEKHSFVIDSVKPEEKRIALKLKK
ncbi:MAG: S1 RNA-binding domain-containing protein [Patescibacteria group bacterium]